jgi:hypothetical protein
MFDFPNSPTNGQIVTNGGLNYQWDTVKWTAIGVPNRYVPELGLTNNVAVVENTTTASKAPIITGYQTPVNPASAYLQIQPLRYNPPVNGLNAGGPALTLAGYADTSHQPGSVTIWAGPNDATLLQWRFGSDGTLSAPGNLTLANNPNFGLFSDANYFYLKYTSDGWADYWQKSNGTRLWNSNAGSIMTLDPGGSLWTNGGANINGMMIANDIQSRANLNLINGGEVWCGTLSVSGDSLQHNIYVDGGLGLNFRGVYNSGVWYAFGWDGTALNYAINGGGQGQLYTVGQNDGRYVQQNQSVTFWDLHVGGTLYAQNGTAQFNTISVGGYCYGGDMRCASGGIFYNDWGHRIGFTWGIGASGRLNAWVDGGWQDSIVLWNDSPTFGNCQVNSHLGVSGAIDCGDVRPGSCNGVYYGCYGQWVAFWLNAGYQVYIRYGGAYDLYLGNISDERMKQDIAPTKRDCLTTIKSIPLYQFRFKDFGRLRDPYDDTPEEILPARLDEPLHSVGFIAQRMHEVFPEAVYGSEEPRHVHGDPTQERPKNWGIHTDVVLAALVGAVQQLSAEVAELKATRH